MTDNKFEQPLDNPLTAIKVYHSLTMKDLLSIDRIVEERSQAIASSFKSMIGGLLANILSTDFPGCYIRVGYTYYDNNSVIEVRNGIQQVCEVSRSGVEYHRDPSKILTHETAAVLVAIAKLIDDVSDAPHAPNIRFDVDQNGILEDL